MDDIEREMRDSNPLHVRRSTPLSQRAESELSALLATRRLPRYSSLRRIAVVASAIAASLALLITLVWTNLAPHAAAASSPPPLAVSPLPQDNGAILAQLIEMASATASEGASTIISSETWSAEISEATPQSFVQPREVVRTRREDLSGEVVVFAGKVKWGVVPDETSAPEPGSELERTEFRTGEYPLLFRQAPPREPSSVLPYFERYLGLNDSATTGDLFRAIQDLRNEWTFTGEQTAALLEVISASPDVEVLGRVQDRLGRQGIALSTSTRGDGIFQDVLVFDTHSGALLSAEEVYLGGLADAPIDPFTVLNYTAWKESQ